MDGRNEIKKITELNLVCVWICEISNFNQHTHTLTYKKVFFF